MQSIPTLILPVSNNEGYGAYQVYTTTTLAELLEAVEIAIDLYGNDAIIVTKDIGNRYGAQYGGLSLRLDDIYEADPDEDEDDQ